MSFLYTEITFHQLPNVRFPVTALYNSCLSLKWESGLRQLITVTNFVTSLPGCQRLVFFFLREGEQATPKPVSSSSRVLLTSLSEKKITSGTWGRLRRAVNLFPMVFYIFSQWKCITFLLAEFAKLELSRDSSSQRFSLYSGRGTWREWGRQPLPSVFRIVIVSWSCAS